MNIQNTGNPTVQPYINMLVYGEGGVGKSTFASTAPQPLFLDFEGGSKYFGLRGIEMDFINILSWNEVRDQELVDTIKGDKYKTIIVDPIGEAMDKLKRFMIATGDSKLIQKDGSPTMAGWGWLKKTMRDFIKFLRDSEKHVIIVAHIDEKPDEERLVKRPMVETKLSSELVNIVDIVAYMTSIEVEGEDKRILRVESTSDRFIAKDRTGQLGRVIPPNFSEIIEAVQGTKKYAWSKGKDEQEDSKQDDLKVDESSDEGKGDKKTTKKSDSAKSKLDKANEKTNGK